MSLPLTPRLNQKLKGTPSESHWTDSAIPHRILQLKLLDKALVSHNHAPPRGITTTVGKFTARSNPTPSIGFTSRLRPRQQRKHEREASRSRGVTGHAAERGQADPTAGGDRREEGNAHLEVDEREGEGLERVVVAEEGAQPRPDSEQRRRAAGHPGAPGEPGRGGARRSLGGWPPAGRRRGRRGGIRGGISPRIRVARAGRGRRRNLPSGRRRMVFSRLIEGAEMGVASRLCLICFGKSLSLLYLFISKR